MHKFEQVGSNKIISCETEGFFEAAKMIPHLPKAKIFFFYFWCESMLLIIKLQIFYRIAIVKQI